MRHYFWLFFLILIPQLTWADSSTHKIDQLFIQKNINQQWFQDVNTELKVLMVNNPKQDKTLQYAYKVFNLPQFDVSEEYSIELIKIISQIHQDKGSFDSSTYYLNSYLKRLGGQSQKHQYVPVWLEYIYNYDAQGKVDSMKYVLDVTSDVVKKGTSQYYTWLMAKEIYLANIGKYNEAIEICFESLSYYEKIKAEKEMAIIYNALGSNYNSINNYKNALEYYILASQLNNKFNKKQDLAMNFNNLGSVYSSLKEYGKANDAYSNAYVLIKELGDIKLLAQNLMNRGNVYEKQGDYKSSMKLFRECYHLCKQYKIDYGVMLSLLNMGNTKLLLKEYDDAEQFLKEALLLSLQMKVKRMEAYAYEKLANLYLGKNNFKLAYEMKNKYHLLDDSLRGIEIEKESLILKEQFESEKKSNTIHYLKNQKLVQQFIILLLVAGVIILFVIVQWYRNKQKASKLSAELMVIEQVNLKKVVEAKEKELTIQITQTMKLEDQIQETYQKIIQVLDLGPQGAEAIKKQIRQLLTETKDFTQINEVFNQRIAEFNEDFFKFLLQHYSDLSPTELKLCAYLRLNLSTKEIAQLLNKSVRTIESTRTDIRKKMKLSSEVNLVNHLLTIRV